MNRETCQGCPIEECHVEVYGLCNRCDDVEDWLADHDKQIIDKFAHELKETFNQETPSNMSCYEKYFALDDCRMWIDIIAEQLKEEQNE